MEVHNLFQQSSSEKNHPILMWAVLSTEKRAVRQSAIALKIHLSHRVRDISSQKVIDKFDFFY